MIRLMTAADKPAVLAMMRTFYASPAVFSDGSDAIFATDIDTCLAGSPYLEGYVFEEGGLAGYAMIAKSFSTEFGKPCIWIEDLFVDAAHRGKGLGGAFIDFITARYPDHLFRLEAEAENEGAVRLYERHGFTVLPYMEMKR